MPDAEREFIKTVDEEILNASPSALKKMQKLDLRTQLKEMTFYDAYSKLNPNGKTEKPQNNPRFLEKSKR